MWGTRGSQATPGNETVRYGGNTSCVEVRATPDTAIVLDAGTGIRRLGRALGPEIVRVDVLLTHLHMDHIQGLGFFDVLYRPGFEVHIWGPGSATADLRTRLTRYMSPPLFPVRLTDLPCDLHLHDIHQSTFAVPGRRRARRARLPSGTHRRLPARRRPGSLAYLPDHEPALACTPVRRFDPEWCSGFELAAGVDVLIHDAQYTDRRVRRPHRLGTQHTRAGTRVRRARAVGRLVPFHHDPEHDDDMLDDFFRNAPVSSRATFDIAPAHEGDEFEVGPRT